MVDYAICELHLNFKKLPDIPELALMPLIDHSGFLDIETKTYLLSQSYL